MENLEPWLVNISLAEQVWKAVNSQKREDRKFESWPQIMQQSCYQPGGSHVFQTKGCSIRDGYSIQGCTITNRDILIVQPSVLAHGQSPVWETGPVCQTSFEALTVIHVNTLWIRGTKAQLWIIAYLFKGTMNLSSVHYKSSFMENPAKVASWRWPNIKRPRVSQSAIMRGNQRERRLGAYHIPAARGLHPPVFECLCNYHNE